MGLLLCFSSYVKSSFIQGNEVSAKFVTHRELFEVHKVWNIYIITHLVSSGDCLQAYLRLFTANRIM